MNEGEKGMPVINHEKVKKKAVAGPPKKTVTPYQDKGDKGYLKGGRPTPKKSVQQRGGEKAVLESGE